VENSILAYRPIWLRKPESTAKFFRGCSKVNILNATNLAEQWCEETGGIGERGGVWIGLKSIKEICQASIKRISLRGEICHLF
jgi:hypothetical protein